MVHGSLHRAAHLRHGRREIKLPRQEVETVVEIVFQTASQTFDGPADFVTPTLMVGSPAQQTQEPEQEQEQEQESEEDTETSSAPEPTVISAPVSAEPTNSQLLTAEMPSSTRATIASATGAAPSSSSSAASTNDGGMSAGGTAGLVIGILLLVGVACALALFFIKKKKQNKDASQAIDDNEKAGDFTEKAAGYGGAGAMVPASVSPSIRTARTTSTAPRLSLRPVTEFDPALEEKRRSAANALQMASAPVAGGMRSPASSQPSLSPWERRGSEKHGHDDPFSDPVNPFGPDASHHADVVPQSPSSVSNHLVEDSTLVAGAAAGGVVAAAAAAANSSRKPLPYPQDTSAISAIASEKPEVSEKIVPEVKTPVTPVAPVVEQPRSPERTQVENVPASPGPAPVGPPPMAVVSTPPASGPDNVHRVQLDFKPSLEDELEIRAGQLVRMLHEYDDGWALCIRMDRSQQGVVPRSCLSKLPVKPRQGPPPGQGQRRGPPPGPRGPGGPNGSNSPRPLTPNGRNSPAPMSPARGPNFPGPMSPARGPNSPGPSQQVRPRANTGQGHPRSMSPGPYGGSEQPPRPHRESRQRSNSAGAVNARRQSPPGPSPMNPNPGPQSPERKPVPGMAL